ncbi:hypothetical protein, partial [Sphingobium limneticum]|uniref:hypothetical protein n=1 Tax=Sphingobium limneticum TaxID=1007511 RepID=UPI001B879294
RCSTTIRTARSRTSGENLLVVLLITDAPSHKLEPPGNPGRFSCPVSFVALADHRAGGDIERREQ